MEGYDGGLVDIVGGDFCGQFSAVDWVFELCDAEWVCVWVSLWVSISIYAPSPSRCIV